MIAWYWIPIAFFAGTVFGFFVAAIMTVAAHTDEVARRRGV